MRRATKLRLRTAHTVLFVLVVADGFAAFGCFMVIRNGAAEMPTGDQVAPLRDHGRTFYVTRPQSAVYRALLVSMCVGVPLVILSGAILDLVLRVPIFGRRGPPERT